MVIACARSFFCCYKGGKTKAPLAVVPKREMDKREEIKQLVAETFPKLNCPFKSALNPSTESVQQKTISWVRRFQLIQGEKEFSRFCASKYAYLIGGAHPTCKEEVLSVISDWLGWLFIYDDRNEGMAPQGLKEFNNALLSVLKGEVGAEDQSDPLIRGMGDLRRRIEEIKPSMQWLDRFIGHVGRHFSSVVCEAENRERSVEEEQTLKTYMAERLNTGGVDIMFDFIELARGIEISNSMCENKKFQEAKNVANLALCFENDIISSPKEAGGKGLTHNAIFIVQKERDCSLQKAFYSVADLYYEQVERFSTLKQGFEGRDEALMQYMGEVSTWLGSHHVWAKESVRYKV